MSGQGRYNLLHREHYSCILIKEQQLSPTALISVFTQAIQLLKSVKVQIAQFEYHKDRIMQALQFLPYDKGL